jgi:hypothetical protein
MPRRYRNREHLRCRQADILICGRTPFDPHHLRYLQPRALGHKARDEFAVPLCEPSSRYIMPVAMVTHLGDRASADRNWAIVDYFL